MEMGEIIKNEWLARCSRHLVSCKAQKIERVWNNETALIEIVKYGSKIFTEPDIKGKTSRIRRKRYFTLPPCTTCLLQ
jgi:hypothetical protein